MLLARLRPLCIGITIGICFCGTTSLVIGYSGGLESNFRQLGSTTTRRQTLLIVPPTFPSARSPKPTPKQHRYRQYNLNSILTKAMIFPPLGRSFGRSDSRSSLSTRENSVTHSSHRIMPPIHSLESGSAHKDTNIDASEAKFHPR